MVAEISERHRACPAYRLNLKLSQGLYGICKYLESIDVNANVLLVNSRDDAVWPKQKGVPCQCAWLAFPCKYMENSSPGFLSWSFCLISWLVFFLKISLIKIHNTCTTSIGYLFPFEYLSLKTSIVESVMQAHAKSQEVLGWEHPRKNNVDERWLQWNADAWNLNVTRPGKCFVLGKLWCADPTAFCHADKKLNCSFHSK